MANRNTSWSSYPDSYVLGLESTIKSQARQIEELKAKISQLQSDAAWEADNRREDLERERLKNGGW